MEFRRITLADRAEFERCISASGTLAYDASFTSMFIWQRAYNVGYCLENGFIFRRGEDGRYRFPIGGGDVFAALAKIERDAKERGAALQFNGLTKEQCEIVAQAFPAREFEFIERPDFADYIYNASDLIFLKGKRYHSKRNFINRFKRENDGRYEITPITKDDIDSVWEYNKAWCERNGCVHDQALLGEFCAIKIALSNFFELGLVGRLLNLDGRIIAYTFASRIGENAVDVHVEKAEDGIAGAYQVINNALASAPEFEGVRYINREEDMGKEGLRKAKQSYCPEILLMRYNAR